MPPPPPPAGQRTPPPSPFSSPSAGSARSSGSGGAPTPRRPPELEGALEPPARSPSPARSPQELKLAPRSKHQQLNLDLALLKASASGDLAALQSAHAAGADINAVGVNGGLVMHFAAKGGHVPVVRYLLGECVPVDVLTAPSAGGFAPLWIAAQFGKAEVIAVLVEAGAQVNCQPATDGCTALWIASGKGRTAACQQPWAIYHR